MPRYRLVAGETGVTLRTEPDAPRAGLSAYMRGVVVFGSVSAGTQLLEVDHPAARIAAVALYGGAGLLAWQTWREIGVDKRADALARRWIELNLSSDAVQPVAPDATPRTQPDELRAVREARHELMNLVNAAANVAGWDSNVIPSAVRLGWRPEKRLNVLRPIAAELDTSNRGTFLKRGTLRELYDALREKRVPLALPAAAVPGAE